MVVAGMSPLNRGMLVRTVVTSHVTQVRTPSLVFNLTTAGSCLLQNTRTHTAYTCCFHFNKRAARNEYKIRYLQNNAKLTSVVEEQEFYLHTTTSMGLKSAQSKHPIAPVETLKISKKLGLNLSRCSRR